MKTFSTKKGYLIPIFLLPAFFSNAWAGNTFYDQVSTRGGTFQAFTPVADDPSAIFYNPAGLTQISGTEIDADLTYITPNMNYFNSTVGSGTNSTLSPIVPSIFASTDKVKGVTLGIGVYSPFARTSQYMPNAAVYGFNQLATIVRTDLVPTAAIDITPYLSTGVGLVMSRVDVKSDILGFRQVGDGYGFTGQAGLLLKLPKQINFGVTFRGPMTADVYGTGKIPGVQGGFSSDTRFPGVIASGVSWQVIEPLLVAFEYDYEMWNYVQTQRQSYSNPVLNALGTTILNGKNSSDFRLGVEYKPTTKDELRAGFSHEQESIPINNVAPATPDYPTNYYSIGYSRNVNKQLRLDAGYIYVKANSTVSGNPIFPGQYSTHANYFMLGLGYKLA